MLGILGAIPQEIDSLVAEMKDRETRERGMRAYHRGSLWGKDVVVVYSRCGKVSAAATATELIASYGVNSMLFTGVAGAASPELGVGDIVVGTRLLQHDMDASPLFKRYEIPFLGVAEFGTDPALTARLTVAAREFLGRSFERVIPREVREEFGLDRPRLSSGLVASGDRFFADGAALGELKGRLPEVLCVEMEGAAVAQVCHEYGVPFAVVRTISDTADHHAPVDFPRFVDRVASRYARGILQALLAG